MPGWRLLMLLISGCCPVFASADCVILLHGLARTAASMNQLAVALEAQGYAVANIDYPSRSATVEELAGPAIEQGLQECQGNGAGPRHFVTHSMGGILLRWYLSEHEIDQLGSVVMLAPPNHGSEVVDVFGKVPGFAWFNGPAGLQLGTDAQSLLRRLPPVNYPVGVIAGTGTINFILSTVLPDPDDGKVSVANTRVAGMQDHITVPYSHPYIMQREAVFRLVINFLAYGRFQSAD